MELNQRKLINKNLQELNYNKFLINIRYCMSFSGNYELLDKISILNILDENDNCKLINKKSYVSSINLKKVLSDNFLLLYQLFFSIKMIDQLYCQFFC